MNKSDNKKVLISLKSVGLAYSIGKNIWNSAKHVALEDITFDLVQGESLGVVGNNGSGKSSLLKILAGIIVPDSGSIQTASGITSTMLSLGAGFISDISGRDNIFFGGMLFGMSYKEVKKRIDDIIELFGYPDFIDSPMASYSAGMRSRLGFAVAYFASPDIILLDEVLGVGDKDFRMKSQKLMTDKIKSNQTVVFVSHNPRTVAELCNRAVWLENGKIRMIGESDAIIKAYASLDISKEK